ncbi:MAG TPA: deoxyribonuclease II family protein [Terracidiphilus sp.]|nr:deoxyribonuclease II family protein [Terracidiphilus sp.]
MVLFLLGVMNTGPSQAHALKAAETQTPSPLLSKGHGVDWWFVFKFNAITFPRPSDSKPTCMFGGHPGGQPRAKDFGKSSGKPFKRYTKIGQDFVFASNEQPSLQKGDGYLGDSTDDPLGATFDEVYNGDLYFVIWNDQFYGDPALRCEKGRPYCSGPWAHSKGIIAWDAKGDGFMIQVTTPDWPGSGSADYKRKEGNSLGCTSDNNVSLSQDFFALKLPKKDLLKVLAALEEEGAVTDLDNPQIVKSGGPKDVTDAVAALGKTNPKETFTDEKLSSGIRLISKSGSLYVPPWQMISAVLGGIPLRVASFRSPNPIDTTIQRKTPPCWSKSLSAPGPVQAASSGSWDGESIGFTTGTNHAKIGVSTSSDSRITIFSDMNDAGTLAPDETNNSCAVSQNGRGGMFFVLENKVLRDSVAGLLSGDSAETVRY